jgi:hypothetical protein
MIIKILVKRPQPQASIPSSNITNSQHFLPTKATSSIMQPSILLLTLTASASAFNVYDCNKGQHKDLKAGKCHGYAPGDQAMYQSGNNCRVPFYNSGDCTGAAWGSHSQNKCLKVPGGGQIRSVFCNED